MRIAELAERVGVPTSTVRYYERIGLLPGPGRTPSGYRDYGDDAAARLLFITRGRRIGLSCDQIADLLPVWIGTNCAGTHARVRQLVQAKRAEIRERIAEMERFDHQLEAVGVALDGAPPPPACRTDLSCCFPDAGPGPVAVELVHAVVGQRPGERPGGPAVGSAPEGEGPRKPRRKPPQRGSGARLAPVPFAPGSPGPLLDTRGGNHGG